MMNRGHFKYTLFREFIYEHLQNDGQKLYHIDNPGNDHDLRDIEAEQQSHDRAAQEQRARVPHEYLCGMEVENEEARKAADYGACQHRYGLRPAAQPRRQTEKHDRNRHRGQQTVQPVGEIHRVHHAHNQQKRQYIIRQPQFEHDVCKRNQNTCGNRAAGIQKNQKRRRGEHLQNQLLHGGKAEVALLFHFDVVVAETDCAEHEGEDEGREHGDVPMHVISVAGDQKRRENAHAEQNPAHGGNPLFALVPGGPLFQYALPEFELFQHRNHKRAQQGCNHKGRHTGQNYFLCRHSSLHNGPPSGRLPP